MHNTRMCKAIEEFERRLVAHCAPTLAGLKTANLFRLPKCGGKDAREWVNLYDVRLSSRGVRLRVLCQSDGNALVYVYRPGWLLNDIKSPEAYAFLAARGYGEFITAENALDMLRARIGVNGEFPHEIGLFLGYPLHDVLGFIRNRGRNYRCSGCWKVYEDAGCALRRFARYRKCREIYLRNYDRGKNVMQLTIAA